METDTTAGQEHIKAWREIAALREGDRIMLDTVNGYLCGTVTRVRVGALDGAYAIMLDRNVDAEVTITARNVRLGIHRIRQGWDA